MQMRLHREQPVELALEQAREHARADRLAGAKRGVLAQVRQVGRDQSDARCTLVTQRPGGEQHPQHALLGMREVGQHRDVRAAHLLVEAQQRLAVRERVQRVRQAVPAGRGAQRGAEPVVAQVEQPHHRTGSSMLSAPRCVARKSSA